MDRSQDVFAVGVWGFILGCITTNGPDWLSALLWAITLAVMLWKSREAR